MKFIIDNETEPEVIVRLRLVKDSNSSDCNNINLVAYPDDSNVNPTYLMSFENGMFYRYRKATIDGIETDKDGRIKENCF